MGLTTLAELARVLSGAAVVIAIVFGTAQMRQFQPNDGWLNAAVFINPAMTIALLVVYFARPGKFRDVVATLFFLTRAFALLFVYSSPTEVS